MARPRLGLCAALGLLPLAILAPGPAAGDAAIEALRARCEAAREARIAPLRAEAVAACVSQPRSTRSRADCERINRDFGAGGPTAAGGFREPMFMDLPECVALREAEAGQVRRRAPR
jgi:hypothetical protein